MKNIASLVAMVVIVSMMSVAFAYHDPTATELFCSPYWYDQAGNKYRVQENNINGEHINITSTYDNLRKDRFEVYYKKYNGTTYLAAIPKNSLNEGHAERMIIFFLDENGRPASSLNLYQ